MIAISIVGKIFGEILRPEKRFVCYQKQIQIAFLGSNNALLLQVPTISASAMCSQLFLVNNVVTQELFPTAIRNTAISFEQISNRLGAALAPHAFLLVS